MLALSLGGPWLAAAQHDPRAVLLNNKGVALLNQQQTEKAEAALAEACRVDKTLPEAQLNDGIALLYLQKLPEAEAALKRSIALKADNPRSWYNLGLVQRAANETDEAIASFKRARELDPTDADSLYFEGVCLQDKKEWDAAIEAFGQALKMNSQHASAEFAMARALQRSGHADQAKPHFVRFQHLTGAKVSSALGLSYGDQGHYSTAVPVVGERKSKPAMIPVKFTEQPLVKSRAATKKGVPSSGGSCMLDVDGDGLYDLVLMESGQSAVRVLRNRGDGSFEELAAEKAGMSVSGTALSCAAGDYDADGLNDLAVALTDKLVLFHNLGKGKFEDATEKAGLAAHNKPQAITFADYDHDGDLDLFLTGAALKEGGTSNVLWRNNGNGTFTDWTEQTALGGSGSTEAVTFSDLNNDRAVDLAVTGDGGGPVLYMNPREGKYPSQPLYERKGDPASVGITAFDFNKDGWMDLLVTHAGPQGVTLWRNKDGKNYEAVDLPVHDALRAWGATAIDVDNDGWLDIAVIVETRRGAEVRVFRNRGDGGFDDVSKAMGCDKLALDAPRGLTAMDIDKDGAADLLVTSASGDPVWLRNEGGSRNRSVLVKLKGLADNKTGLGTKIEAYTPTNWQKFEVVGASGYLSQGPPEVLVGLGAEEGVDLLRFLWPTGVPQDEIQIARTPVVDYPEADRRGSSCPVLFAWNGKRYVLVTDTIGAAVVGHWFTPTRRNIPDSDEWIKVDGSLLAAVHGKLSLRFTEPMEEVNYIDQLRLMAVDHPEGTEVYPDERFLDEPPFASGAVIVSQDAHLPAGAWNEEGPRRARSACKRPIKVCQ